MENSANPTWYERVPKIELHLHLEGAIPYPALWDLVQKYGGDLSVPTPRALAERFVFRNFPHFIETWVWKNGFLREYEDFTFIAEAVARDLALQNIRYAEVFYSPPDFFLNNTRRYDAYDLPHLPSSRFVIYSVPVPHRGRCIGRGAAEAAPLHYEMVFGNRCSYHLLTETASPSCDC